MPPPETIVITLFSVAAFVGGAWFLLRTQRFDATSARLVALASLAAAGYFLGLAATQSEPVELADLVSYTRRSVGFYLLFCGLAPWCASRATLASPSLSLILHSGATALLLIVNYRSEFSLLHESVRVIESAESGVFEIERLTSVWAVSLAASVFASFALVANAAYRLALDCQRRRATALGVAAFTLPATFFWDFAQLTSSEESSDLTWLGVASLLAALYANAFSTRTRQAPPQIRVKFELGAIGSEDDAVASFEARNQPGAALLLGFSQTDERLLSKLLSSRGYVVMQEASLPGSLDSYLSEHPDCRLIAYDLEATEADSSSTLKSLQAEPVCFRSLVYTKGLNSPKFRRKLRTRNIPFALRKPPRAKELFQALDTLESTNANPLLPRTT